MEIRKNFKFSFLFLICGSLNFFSTSSLAEQGTYGSQNGGGSPNIISSFVVNDNDTINIPSKVTIKAFSSAQKTIMPCATVGVVADEIQMDAQVPIDFAYNHKISFFANRIDLNPLTGFVKVGSDWTTIGDFYDSSSPSASLRDFSGAAFIATEKLENSAIGSTMPRKNFSELKTGPTVEQEPHAIAIVDSDGFVRGFSRRTVANEDGFKKAPPPWWNLSLPTTNADSLELIVKNLDIQSVPVNVLSNNGQ